MSDWPWTISQRRALIALVGAVTVFLGIAAHRSPVYVGPVPGAVGIRAAELEDRLDPNTASAADLSSLPELGRKRAAEIVGYREDFVAAHPGKLAFSRPEDLRRIKGIGPATVEKIAPFLSFEAR
jgi:DNA uptake protein ComE-like DNA-binding protein